MHQSTTASLLQTIWQRWASIQFLTLPIVQTLLPVTFAYSLSTEAVVMKQLRRWKRLWRGSLTRSHKKTSMGPSSRSFRTVQQVHCSRRRKLRRGLEFHVFTINVSIRKNSGNLFIDLVYIYIYIYYLFKPYALAGGCDARSIFTIRVQQLWILLVKDCLPYHS